MATDISGVFRFVFDDALRAFWQERVGRQELSEAEQAAMLGEIEKEAAGAEIEIVDSHIESRSRGTAFYRVPLRVEPEGFGFDKPGGPSVLLVRLDDDKVEAREPGKPPMRFERVR